MTGMLMTLLNMSITASWLILAVTVIRLPLKRAPRWISCALWVLVAIRLICPFSLESRLSLIPNTRIIPQNIAVQEDVQFTSGIAVANVGMNSVTAGQFTSDPLTNPNPVQTVLHVMPIVWIAGIVALLGYALLSFIRLRKRVGASIAVRDNILACDDVRSPFVLGVLHPVIYVPSAMAEGALDHVIAHETAHLMRHDHWWKAFGYLLLSVYWFNPLCWLAYVLLCRDIEIACDEKVIRDMDHSDRALYAQTLLDHCMNRRSITVYPLCFGEVGVKERVKIIVDYRKIKQRNMVAALVICVIFSVCFMTPPSGSASTVTGGALFSLDEMEEIDASVIPGDTIAILTATSATGDPAIIFAVHGVTFDEETISISVMQISADAQYTVYEDDVYGESEQSLRHEYGLGENEFMIGSYCELYIGRNNRVAADEMYYREGHTGRIRNDCIDEPFVFSTSDMTATESGVSFDLCYGAVLHPGQIDKGNIALYSFTVPYTIE